MAVRLEATDADVPMGTPLKTRSAYLLEADVAETEAEVFTPPAEDGLPDPDPRKESLFLSWFVTTGVTHRDDGDIRTVVHEGGEFSSLIENRWEMPFDLETAKADFGTPR